MARKKSSRRTKKSVNYNIDTPYLIRQMDPAEQRREYTALRDIVTKRIKRIELSKVKPGQADPRYSEFYKEWKKGVPKLRNVTPERLPYLLAALKRSVQAPEATIKGYRESVKKRVKGMHAAGFTWINESNLGEFGEFMEEFRARKMDHVVGSPEVAEFWVTIQKREIDKEDFFNNFKSYMANKDSIKRMRKPMKTGKIGEYKKYLTKQKKWKEVKK